MLYDTFHSIKVLVYVLSKYSRKSPFKIIVLHIKDTSVTMDSITHLGVQYTVQIITTGSLADKTYIKYCDHAWKSKLVTWT